MKLSSSDDDLDFVNKKKKLRFGVQFSQEGNSREKFMVGSKSWGCIMFALVYIYFMISLGQFELFLADLVPHPRKQRNNFREHLAVYLR